MPQWTVEQALALAPDAASGTAGRGLATAAKWESAGATEAAAWGEAKGSGTKPYQVTVDLGDGASKCSCPSRKFPCKHALGLLIRVAQGGVAAGAPPDWATQWLEKRGEKAVAKAERPARQADPKSADKRWATVLRGLDECETFLHDAVGQGLLSMGAARSWDEMARRMVDAQAPGVARRLRRVGETIGVGEDWGARAGADLGSLALLVQAARNVEALGDLARDVHAALGIPATPGEERVTDVWDVLGTVAETEDRLQSWRTWLRGRATGRWALHLAFAPLGGPSPPRPVPGRSIAAEARFFASAWPLRAQFEETEGATFAPRAGGTWAEALDAQADALALNPWVERFPVALRGAALAEEFVVDAEGVGVPLRNPPESRWRLLAATGNAPSEFFGEFDDEAFTLLGAWGAWGVLAL